MQFGIGLPSRGMIMEIPAWIAAHMRVCPNLRSLLPHSLEPMPSAQRSTVYSILKGFFPCFDFFLLNGTIPCPLPIPI